MIVACYLLHIRIEDILINTILSHLYKVQAFFIFNIPSMIKMVEGTLFTWLIIQVSCLSFDMTRSSKKTLSLTFIITLIEHDSTAWITHAVITPT